MGEKIDSAKKKYKIAVAGNGYVIVYCHTAVSAS